MFGSAVLFFTLICLCYPTRAQVIAPAENPAFTSSRLLSLKAVTDDNVVRVVLELAGTAEPIGFFSKGTAYRYVIDLHSTQLSDDGKRAAGDLGFFEKVEFGHQKNGTLRLVFGASVPFLLKENFILPAKAGAPKRAVFDFFKVTDREFVKAIRQQTEDARKKAKARLEKTVARKRAAREDIGSNKRKWRIVIDPGHGGKDGGAKTKAGVLEKEIVLSFSKNLAAALRRNKAFDITLTREEDIFVPLSDRVELARTTKADLFISIHADSLPADRRVRGTAVYTISEKASDRLASQLVDQQNKAGLIDGYELKSVPNEIVDILFDLTRRETSNLSSVFARHFVSSMKGKIRFFKFPVQRGAFTVLRVPEIPSALIELGFLSNNVDAKQLSAPQWRERVALDMAVSIAAYFQNPLLRGK